MTFALPVLVEELDELERSRPTPTQHPAAAVDRDVVACAHLCDEYSDMLVERDCPRTTIVTVLANLER